MFFSCLGEISTLTVTYDLYVRESARITRTVLSDVCCTKKKEANPVESISAHIRTPQELRVPLLSS